MSADKEPRFCEMAGATRPKFCLTLQRWLSCERHQLIIKEEGKNFIVELSIWQ